MAAASSSQQSGSPSQSSGAFQFFLDFSITFDDSLILSSNDKVLEKISPRFKEAQYSGEVRLTGFDSLQTHIYPLYVIYKRVSPTQLKPHSYVVLHRGEDILDEMIPWPEGGVLISSCQNRISSHACLIVDLLCQTAAANHLLGTEMMGSCAVSLLQAFSLTQKTPNLTRMKLPLECQGSVVARYGEVIVSMRDYRSSKITEIFDASFQPKVQSVVLASHCALGWRHMVRSKERSSRNVAPFPPLIPVAAMSVVPNLPETTGIMPVDMFTAKVNPGFYPVIGETMWLKVATNAALLHSLSLEEVEQLLDENLEQEHYRPRFLLVLKTVMCIAKEAVNCMPYVADELKVIKSGEVKRTGTDRWRNAFAQNNSGDCDDLSSGIYVMYDLFNRATFTISVLFKLQRLAGCFSTWMILIDVTSSKLEMDSPETNEQDTEYTPIAKRMCGLHAGVIAIPRATFREQLARSLKSPEEAMLVPIKGYSQYEDADLPRIHKALPTALLEGTGRIDPFPSPYSHTIIKQARLINDAQVIRESIEFAKEETARWEAVKYVLGRMGSSFKQFSLKPEMRTDDSYEYDLKAIVDGHKKSLSEFFVAGVGLYSVHPLLQECRHCYFDYFFRKDQGKDTLYKTAYIDSIMMNDERVVIAPMPAIHEIPFKCSMAVIDAEPATRVVQQIPNESGPDELLNAFTQLFESIGPVDKERYLSIDFFLPNKKINAIELISEIETMKQKLLQVNKVKMVQYQTLTHNAGLSVGLLRVYMDKL